jgi:hypothetical protein
VFNLLRNFESRYGAASGSALLSGTKQSLWADSFGGGLDLPLFEKKFDVMLTGLYGKGGGRYGTSQLSDVTYGADGSLNPLVAVQYLAQLYWHTSPTFDTYVTYGQEKVNSAVGAGSTFGYGDSVVSSNQGCTFFAGTCSPQIKSVSQENVGVWWSFYKGSYGVAKLGGQYSHTDLKTYADAGGLAPSTKVDQGYVSFRYYPF